MHLLDQSLEYKNMCLHQIQKSASPTTPRPFTPIPYSTKSVEKVNETLWTRFTATVAGRMQTLLLLRVALCYMTDAKGQCLMRFVRRVHINKHKETISSSYRRFQAEGSTACTPLAV